MGQVNAKAVHYRSYIHRRNVDKHGPEVLDLPPLFSGILPLEFTEISAAGRPREFRRGEMLHVEGDSVRQVCLLTSGLVKITKLGPGGTEVILRLGGPGEVLGAADPLSTGIHGTTAQAFRVCRALVWDATVFKALVAPFPILHQNMARILGRHLLELEERFREVATERVPPRVARQIVRLLEQIGRTVDGGIEIGVSREELAQMTGTTLFTVSRLLSAWEALGMVKPRREAVAICDVQSLRSVAKGSASETSSRTLANRALGLDTPNQHRPWQIPSAVSGPNR